MKQKARLENWYVNYFGSLAGDVFGHPKFEDGTYITTSTVQDLDIENSKAVTLNTEYTLGKERKIED